MRAVAVGYKCHCSWHLPSGRQWLDMGWAPRKGEGGLALFQCILVPHPLFHEPSHAPCYPQAVPGGRLAGQWGPQGCRAGGRVCGRTRLRGGHTAAEGAAGEVDGGAIPQPRPGPCHCPRPVPLPRLPPTHTHTVSLSLYCKAKGAQLRFRVPESSSVGSSNKTKHVRHSHTHTHTIDATHTHAHTHTHQRLPVGLLQLHAVENGADLGLHFAVAHGSGRKGLNMRDTTGLGMTPAVHCCLQPAAPIGLSPLALPLNSLPLEAAAPIGLSRPRALVPPLPGLSLPPYKPFLSLGRLWQRSPRRAFGKT